MPDFATIVAVDFSAAASPSPSGPSADAPWIAVAAGDGPARLVGPHEPGPVSNHRTRTQVMVTVQRLIAASTGPTLVGWDFGLGYPAGLADALGVGGWMGVWALLDALVEDADDNANNRFDVGARLNDRFADGGPFWGVLGRDVERLAGRLDQRRSRSCHERIGIAERRMTERQVPGAQPMFKLAYAGSVGSQSLLGIARLQRLRRVLGERVAVWPFEPVPVRPDAVVLAEIYPTLFTPNTPHPAAVQRPGGLITTKDAHQVLHTVDALRALGVSAWDRSWMPAAVVQEEGWILGVGRP